MAIKTNKIHLVNFLSLIVFSITLDSEMTSENWTKTCQAGEQSLIDISPPFTYKNINISFEYSVLHPQYNLSHDSNILSLKGDFGYIIYERLLYYSTEILFFSPSAHSFMNKKFTLELCIVHINSKGEKLIISLFFKESTENFSLLLEKIGFDNPNLKNLKNGKIIEIKNEIDLSYYLSKDKVFFIYDGVDILSPFEQKATYLIISDIFNVNTRQISNFPILVKNKFKTISELGRRNIYINIPIDSLYKNFEENNKIDKEDIEGKGKNKNQDESIDSIEKTNQLNNVILLQLDKNQKDIDNDKEMKEKKLQFQNNYIKKKDSEKSLDYFDNLLNKKIYFKEIASPYNRQPSYSDQLIKLREFEKKVQIAQLYTLNGRRVDSDIYNDELEIFDVFLWPSECLLGNYLSPINFEINNNLPRSKFNANFNVTGPTGKIIIFNNNYKLVVSSEGGFGQIKFEEHIYNVKKVLISHKSEHTFDNKRADMELQIICEDTNNILLAISILLEEGKEDFPFLKPLGFNNLDNLLFTKRVRSGEKIVIENSIEIEDMMNLGKYLNNKEELFVTYIGSTTTPPCISNVRWLVMAKKLTLSFQQIKAFPVLFGRNYNVRGLQLINGRSIELIE